MPSEITRNAISDSDVSPVADSKPKPTAQDRPAIGPWLGDFVYYSLEPLTRWPTATEKSTKMPTKMTMPQRVARKL